METNQSLNKFKQSVLSVDSVIDLILSGKEIDFAIIDDIEELEKFNSNAEQVLHTDKKLQTECTDLTEDEFHSNNIQHWKIPESYKKIDVLSFVNSKCKTEAELSRVKEEYKLYKDRNLISMLQLFIYLVDHFRENNIVWGVGRGSSVSSYILYLIGIHRIDSLKYNLEITEFLR